MGASRSSIPSSSKNAFATIERMFAWEDKFRRLLLRFERISALHYAFKSLAYDDQPAAFLPPINQHPPVAVLAQHATTAPVHTTAKSLAKPDNRRDFSIFPGQSPA